MITNYDLSFQNGIEWDRYRIEIPIFVKNADIVEVSTKIVNILLKYENEGFTVTKDIAFFNKHFNYESDDENWFVVVPIERWAEKKEIRNKYI